MLRLLVLTLLLANAGYFAWTHGLLADYGFDGTFRVMQSNGGLMSAETAKNMAVTMMESGPVAGVPATATTFPTRTAREYPTTGSHLAPEDTS